MSGDLENVMDLAVKLRKAARAVAECGWGTSVTETEHDARIGKMQDLRRALQNIDDVESEILSEDSR